MKILGMIAVISSLLLVACSDNNSEQTKASSQANANPAQQNAKPVKTITIAPQLLTLNKTLPGRVEAYKIAEIRPQVSGIIEDVLFQQGSWVERNQQLYQIDDSQYKADFQSAKARLQNTSAELKIAEVVQKRYQNLIKTNAISEQELDNAEANVAQASAAVALSKADLKRAKINLEYTKVHSPIAGYVGPSTVTQGALVTAQQSVALATVRQIDPIYVDISQSALAAKKLQMGLAARQNNKDIQKEEQFSVDITLGNDGTQYPHTGSLFAIDFAVDENTGTIRVRTVFPNPDAMLLPGMLVQASLNDLQQEKSIIVPQKAVTIGADASKTVWLVNNSNEAKKQIVVAKQSYQNNWIIESGLSAGDKVIVEGMMMLQEGAKVAPTNNESTNK